MAKVDAVTVGGVPDDKWVQLPRYMHLPIENAITAFARKRVSLMDSLNEALASGKESRVQAAEAEIQFCWKYVHEKFE